MRILIVYDGSEGGDAALDDLRNAGLPRDAEALIVSIAEVMMPSSSIGNDVVGRPVTSLRVTEALAQAKARAEQALQEAHELAATAGGRVRAYFPDWKVQTEGLAGWPSTDLINKADEWKADLVVVGSRGRGCRSVWGLQALGEYITPPEEGCYSQPAVPKLRQPRPKHFPDGTGQNRRASITYEFVGGLQICD